MKYMIEFSAGMEELNGYLAMMWCFIDSASTLHGVAIDGLLKNKSNSIGQPTDEVYHQKIIIAFFLLRHALELGIKALINEHDNLTFSTTSSHREKNKLIQFLCNLFCRIRFKKNNNIDDRKLYGHNLKKLWENVNQSYINEAFKKEIAKGFVVLKKYKLLKYAELIRYHVDNKGNQIKNLPPIESKDFEDLLDVVVKVRFAVLEVLESIYQRKFHPVSMKVI